MKENEKTKRLDLIEKCHKNLLTKELYENSKDFEEIQKCKDQFEDLFKKLTSTEKCKSPPFP